ncbi:MULTISPECIES: hypothetical protein [Acinetobacter]|uniref:hypothetical protein n=1 Tax=Acinetobacter TaxID=469 RepID=UPI000538C9FF|nr:hypothetical protein [Acinetobacter sp. HR7]KGT48193.1 hypothetical protein GW12_07710 [Acinetobacter sp. HR7]
MKNTIKTIALSVTFLSGAGMVYAQDTEVAVDTGLQTALNTLSQQVANGSALNLAVNTADINSSVDINAEGVVETTEEVLGTVNNVVGTIETTAMGAVNTGNIAVEQGSLSSLKTSELTASLDNNLSDLEESVENVDGETASDWSKDLDNTVNNELATTLEERLDQTLSNYSVANVAYNSGALDASVTAALDGAENTINNIKTTAIGAVNTGSITVTVK